MNGRVHRYQPLYFSPPPSTRSLTSISPSPNPSWKERLNKQVAMRYSHIQQQPNDNHPGTSSPRNERDLWRGIVPSEVKSMSTQSQISAPYTPAKERQLNIYALQSITTTAKPSGELEAADSYEQYRTRLLEEECIYLRKEFIRHCLKHHKRQFEN